MNSLLVKLYGEEHGNAVLPRLAAIVEKYRGRLPRPTLGGQGISERDAILITYPDQLQEPGRAPLPTLAEFCDEHLKDKISGVHILPFYPWTSDDGFSVVDYRAVDPRYGDWGDVQALGKRFRLMFDAVINHISAQSSWFQAMLHGDARFRDYFVVPPAGADLSKVVRPRALPLLTVFSTAFGEQKIWTTFSADQVDLNYRNPDVLLEIVDLLLFYVQQGAEFIRLDAIAYLWKEPGTTCIHLPQTHAVIRLFRKVLDELAPHVMLITETNVPHADNLSYFGDGTNEAQLVYNFSLPPLVLHAIQTGSAEALSRWAAELALPSTQVTFFNFLASHDGIGINPARGILSDTEIEDLLARVQAHGGRISMKSEPDGTQRPYEMNINYFDALSNPHADEPLEIQVKRFVAAHAILMAITGLPAIYFHSLFGSRGWVDGVTQTGRNRTINREKLARAALEAELRIPQSLRSQVFTGLSRLLRARASSPAFDPYGDQQVLDCGRPVFAVLRRNQADERILCLQNVSSETWKVELDLERLFDPGGLQTGLTDLLSGDRFTGLRDEGLALGPYQVLWLRHP